MIEPEQMWRDHPPADWTGWLEVWNGREAVPGYCVVFLSRIDGEVHVVDPAQQPANQAQLVKDWWHPDWKCRLH